MPVSERSRRLASAHLTRSVALAGANAADVEELWQRVEAGDIDEERFVALATVLTARANVSSVRLADRFVADALTVNARRPVLVEAADPRRYASPRVIADSFLSITRDDGSTARLGRLAHGEPLGAGHARLNHHVRREDRVRWVRVTSAKPCLICSPRAGEPLDPTVGVRLHLNCHCTMAPSS